MAHRVLRPFSSWLLVLVAILVALGAQSLLEALVPASIANLEFGYPDKTVIYRAGSAQFWVAESVIRFVSFLLGGYVGGRLAAEMRPRLVALLVVAAAVTTLLQQLPGAGSALWWALWALLAPSAVAFGAYAPHAQRGEA